jgi:hypothetical protein
MQVYAGALDGRPAFHEFSNATDFGHVIGLSIAHPIPHFPYACAI